MSAMARHADTYASMHACSCRFFNLVILPGLMARTS
jgi:hypothetical protein